MGKRKGREARGVEGIEEEDQGWLVVERFFFFLYFTWLSRRQRTSRCVYAFTHKFAIQGKTK